ncbi:2-hydroxyacid dehydrogenase [Paeniglutamicibacter psychrophenolicus]|uniref:2-hydroxyacid dehydrogenase n=1 Tax=Paeniglutamicibacter psychrophenolicus TaxID=257454 RepID=UPI0027849277|nr:2-hydroxyacid dehydrogenase [Paeniglutamicibacter psychrophenolicus]MDQ0096093.1 phosphoglycerate dehydrogenase-like enzyme [Paeniglutamicibacter psychrophenolicus]
MNPIRVVSFPSTQLLEAVGPLPAGIVAGVWDIEGEPAGVKLEEIDVAIFPYMANFSMLQGIGRARNLKLVQTQTTGYDGVHDLVGPGVSVATAAGVHAASTAELAVGLAIASLRGIGESVRDQAANRWNPARWPGLADRKVAIVGVGGIGEEIRKRLDPFEVELSRFGTRARTDEHGEILAVGNLLDHAKDIEVLILIVPHNASTHHLVDAELLAALPDGAVIVNVARGPVVDTDALVAELQTGRLRCASDVFDPEPLPADHPIWQLPNALVVPHNGGNTEAFLPRMTALLKRQLVAWATGTTPENLVQAP